MKNLHITLALAVVGFPWATANEQLKPTTLANDPFFPRQIYGEVTHSSKIPDGMITTIREKGNWKFKILSMKWGWSTSSGINKMTLKGNGYELPIATSGFATLPDTNRTYTYVTLTDEMLKTAELVIHWSSIGRQGNKAVIYTVKLSELTK